MEYYPFWKVRIQTFLNTIDSGILDVMIKGHFIYTITNNNNLQEPKPFSQWTAVENRKDQYYVRVRNIISSSSTLNEFYRTFVRSSALKI